MELNIVLFSGGALVGAIVVWFVRKYKFELSNGVPQKKYDELVLQNNNSLSEKSRLEERTQNLKINVKELKDELISEREKKSSFQQELARSEAENKNLNEKLDHQKNELETTQKKFTIEFENLANKILEEKSKKFTDQNKSNIIEILNPLNEKIKDFHKKVEETYDKESKERFSLVNEINKLSKLNEQITKEANNLTNALKGESKTQGNWGEMILETLLEKSGLIKSSHFEVQPSYRSEDGKRVQPDVVIYLPEGKHMIIDSKVSLTAYEYYYATEDKSEKEKYLSQHIGSMKKHIDELSGKKYQNCKGINSPDFVLMFVPVEPAFGLAVLHEPGLFNYAVEKNVAIISPVTLLATLRMIAAIWRQENQNKNVLDIAQQSGALYDKFVVFLGSLESIGKHLENGQKSYNEAFKQLKGGSGNIITKIEKIKKLGAKTSKSLKQEVIDEAKANDTQQLEMKEAMNCR